MHELPRNKSLEEIQQAMALLQNNFWSTLGFKSNQFIEAGKQLQQGDFTVLPAIINLAHQLAGSCGTFQFQHVGHLARQIEVYALQMDKFHGVDASLLGLLLDAIEHFITEVNQGTFKTSLQVEYEPTFLHLRQDIWLVLAPSVLRDELYDQLHAFGYQITTFASFSECTRALRKQAPALLFCAATLAGHSLFSQYELLQSANERQSRLMIFSEVDSFEVRIEAIRHKAQGCFVSSLDIPSMLQRISKLFDASIFSERKVSILDDDLLLAEHYSWVLKSAGFEVQVIGEPNKIIAELVAFKPDLLLLDMHMPGFSGAEISGVIRQYDSLSSLHITFLSAEHNIQQQLQALSFGADDFITKPISNENLVTSVKLRLARNREIKSLIERDNLTGLIKHAAIKEVVMTEFDRMCRGADHFCVAMVDLDHFKLINDNYGHAMGDVVISTIATLLRKRLRRSDRAGRYGGEEFMVVLPKCNADDAKVLLDNILSSFKEIHFRAGAQYFSCTFSAGIVASTGNYDSAEMMMNAADEVLYQAKNLGRSQVRILEHG